MSQVHDDTPPHVVMVVANSIANDTRVIKEAIALANSGLRVTLLGVAANGKTSVERLDGGALMVRLPGKFVLRDERNRARRYRRGKRMGEAAAVTAARNARIAARLTDLKAASGRAAGRRKAGELSPVAYKLGVVVRAVQYKRWQAAQKLVRLRRLGAKWDNRVVVPFWKRLDERMGKTSKPVNWRKVIPEAYDYETIFGDVLDRLQPDVIHAHDMHVIGVVSRAAGRAALRGRNVKWVYDAHEYVAGLSQYPPRTARLIAAWAQHEGEYIRTADRVVTVSPAIATTLQKRYRLKHKPALVMNSPSLDHTDDEVVGIRERAGLGPEVPLLVYSGGITRARGVETAIEALPLLPECHLAVVCVPFVAMKPVDELKVLAAKHGVADRVHYLEPVEPNEVVRFLSTADIGLIPILRYPSHEMALPNKVFEYLFAGLPVVTSDMPSLQEFVERTKTGTVFKVQDPADLARAVRKVLEDKEGYRERALQEELHRQVSWEGQADELRSVYGELLDRKLEATGPMEPDEVAEKEIRKYLGV